VYLEVTYLLEVVGEKVRLCLLSLQLVSGSLENGRPIPLGIYPSSSLTILLKRFFHLLIYHSVHFGVMFGTLGRPLLCPFLPVLLPEFVQSRPKLLYILGLIDVLLCKSSPSFMTR